LLSWFHYEKTTDFTKTLLSKFNLIANLTVKNLALHQQLIVLNRSIKRPQIKTKDRLFWIILFLFWKNWQDSLIVLKARNFQEKYFLRRLSPGKTKKWEPYTDKG
jgi:hypothetical protein